MRERSGIESMLGLVSLNTTAIIDWLTQVPRRCHQGVVVRTWLFGGPASPSTPDILSPKMCLPSSSACRVSKHIRRNISKAVCYRLFSANLQRPRALASLDAALVVLKDATKAEARLQTCMPSAQFASWLPGSFSLAAGTDLIPSIVRELLCGSLL